MAGRSASRGFPSCLLPFFLVPPPALDQAGQVTCWNLLFAPAELGGHVARPLAGQGDEVDPLDQLNFSRRPLHLQGGYRLALEFDHPFPPNDEATPAFTVVKVCAALHVAAPELVGRSPRRPDYFQYPPHLRLGTEQGLTHLEVA